MTRDDVAPLSAEEGGLPCECCDGAGTVRGFGGILIRCGMCGGSGYGAPRTSADRGNCLERLSRWAKRNPLPEEN